MHEGGALIRIAAARHALEVEVTVVFVQFFTFQADGWLHTFFHAATQCGLAAIVVFASYRGFICEVDLCLSAFEQRHA